MSFAFVLMLMLMLLETQMQLCISIGWMSGAEWKQTKKIGFLFNERIRVCVLFFSVVPIIKAMRILNTKPRNGIWYEIRTEPEKYICIPI